MIAYNIKEAQAAFAALADVLDKTANIKLIDGKPTTIDLAKIRTVIDADPTANVIRLPFEKVRTLARNAGDTDAETDLLNRHTQLTDAYNAIASSTDEDAYAAADEYTNALRQHAAYIRAFGTAIGLPTIYHRQGNEEASATALQEITQKLEDIKADTTAAAMNTATINNGVSYLIADRKNKMKKNRKRGAENQAKGNTEERQRAAKDMQTALNRVRDRIKDKEKKGLKAEVLDVCRSVCKEFIPLTDKKNALGKYAQYAPLTSESGRAIQPQTLAKNYRERFGTKKERKSKSKQRIK